MVCEKKLLRKAAAGDTEIYGPWYWLGSSRRGPGLAFRRLSCQPSARCRVWLWLVAGVQRWQLPRMSTTGVFEPEGRRTQRGRDGRFRADDGLRCKRQTSNGWRGEACDELWVVCLLYMARAATMRPAGKPVARVIGWGAFAERRVLAGQLRSR